MKILETVVGGGGAQEFLMILKAACLNDDAMVETPTFLGLQLPFFEEVILSVGSVAKSAFAARQERGECSLAALLMRGVTLQLSF